MKINKFPDYIKNYLIPKTSGNIIYKCLKCKEEFNIEKLLYVCPKCNSVLLLYDTEFERLKKIPSDIWRDIFDYRKMLNIPALKGIYLYYEFIGPVIPIDSIVYLGEGHTPCIEANSKLQEDFNQRFYFKNDGLNPSASFKDRGMASALSYINYLVSSEKISEILAICASTGDTSASAALYSSYLTSKVKSAVLLPYKKVTPQQLSQPLGSGASVFEIPGVFDDCMKIVEALSENYNVALLNSKNAWRISGQESYSFEISQDFDYDLKNKVILVPIGNAGNITAVLSGFLKFYETGIIDHLPKIIGVQSDHANPVYNYYNDQNQNRKFIPMTVKPSVAQAAMIGNPVSMPRVIHLVDIYNKTADCSKVFFVSVSEQEIIDSQLIANRNGHIICTHGGETLAGMVKAKKDGFLEEHETAILDSTAHALKFSNFQQLYFDDNFDQEYNIKPKSKLKNFPILVKASGIEKFPAPGKPLIGNEFNTFVKKTAQEIANYLNLAKVK